MSTDTFDRLSNIYDSLIPPHVARHYLERRTELIEAYAPGPRLVEVGCGTGSLAECLAERSFHVTAVDASHGMLTEARKKSLPAIQADSTTLPLPGDTFDLTYCVAMLHHLARSEKTVRQTIREMVRVTRPGGVVLIVDHNPYNPYWKLFMKQIPWDNDVERLIPLDEILGILSESGTNVLCAARKGWVPNFIPPWSLGAVGLCERLLEITPLVRMLGAHNVVVAVKNTAGNSGGTPL